MEIDNLSLWRNFWPNSIFFTYWYWLGQWQCFLVKMDKKLWNSTPLPLIYILVILILWTREMSTCEKFQCHHSSLAVGIAAQWSWYSIARYPPELENAYLKGHIICYYRISWIPWISTHKIKAMIFISFATISGFVLFLISGFILDTNSQYVIWYNTVNLKVFISKSQHK